MNNALDSFDARLAWDEANHRFLNSLATLNGLLRMDFGAFTDPAVREAVSVFSSRVQAFADLQRTLSADSSEALLDGRAHLTTLCAKLSEAHLAPRGIYCDVMVDEGLLPRESFEKLSLVVVELVTNAAKHAFAGRRNRRLGVALQRTSEGWLCQVADNGAGLRNEKDGRGMQLVRALAHSMGGDLYVRADARGTVMAVTLPLDPAHAAVADMHFAA